MTDYTKDDVVRWLADPVTKDYFCGLQLRIDQAKEILSEVAGIDPYQDRFMAGMVRAFKEALKPDFEEIQDDKKD